MIIFEALLFLCAGFVLVDRISQKEPIGVFERACYAAVAGLSLWMGTSWLLALTGTFTRSLLVLRLLVLGTAVLWALWRRRASLIATFARQIPIDRTVVAIVAAAVPLALWCVFVLWRGAIVPPASHDALSYHLPKALLIARNAGYEHLPYLHGSIRTTPVNYELLLAEEMLLTGSDDLTEWPSLLFYLLLAAGSGALAERSRGARQLAIAAVVIATAATPVALLHSGAVKNDVMVCSLIVTAMVAAGRWYVTGRLWAFAVMASAFALAIGTKPQAGAVAACVAPFAVYRVWLEFRRGRKSLAAWTILISLGAFVLLGGAVYLANLVQERSVLNASDGSGGAVEVIPYGHLANLWQGPYVMLASGFATDPFKLVVPWENQPWMWRKYEIYFSTLGPLFTVGVLLLPLLGFLGVRDERLAERAMVATSAVAGLALMLPVEFKPHGLFLISLPRYTLFLVPVIFALLLPPIMDALVRRFASAGIGLLAILTMVFLAHAVEFGAEDAFVPFDYVMWARNHPGNRSVAFDPYRAASVADRKADADDVIAVDAGYGTWVHPAFGAGLSRRVVFIPEGTATPQVAPDVDWVVVDRAYSIVWGHPEFRDLSQAGKYILRGKATAGDLRVFEALRKDSRFELVFYNPRMLQAVFRRVEPERK